MQVKFMKQEHVLDIRKELAVVLDDVLGLGGRAQTFSNETALLGALPELDSMAVVGIIAGMEEHFGIYLADDEIDGSSFATFGSLLRFVEEKLSQDH
jgi:acyl carrier protein